MYRIKVSQGGKLLLRHITANNRTRISAVSNSIHSPHHRFHHHQYRGQRCLSIPNPTTSSNRLTHSAVASAADHLKYGWNHQLQNQFGVGDCVHNYVVESVQEINELCLTAYRLRHVRTGAEHLHIARDDCNNCFAVSFRTTPTDSTGVAHILEHLSLCGSQQFPVRDPFFKMLTRSLATFMNAFTGPDYTMYPFSTQNSKDFYNLLSIYLDATFHPRLRKLDFLQEGWRLEHAEPDDAKTPLVFKGVVFNEMKGVFSSSQSIYSRGLLNALFPDNTYCNESGGDPMEIPHLSYDALKQFHANHYHPSNARFFTYGNFPLDRHLEAIDRVIGKFDSNQALNEQSVVGDQPQWPAPHRVQLYCPSDPLAPYPDKQCTTSVAYMCAPITDIQEQFTLSILGTLLIDGPSSPFYEALIDSGLGSDYSPFSGMQRFTKQSLFTIGLQGIAPDQVSTVHKAIECAFQNAYTEGFAQERIDAILHQIELAIKHQNSQFGLGLAMNVNTYWNHGADPMECLQINQQMTRFKTQLEQDKKFLQKKVKQYFLDNTHKLILDMKPDVEYEQKLAKKEQQLLEGKISSLTESDRSDIFTSGKALQEAQNGTEDLSVLPKLSVQQDISRQVPMPHVEVVPLLRSSSDSSQLSATAQYTTQPTNGIVYLNAVIRLSPDTFPQRLAPYLPLFAQVITKLGAGKWNRRQLDQEIQMRTGGLGVAVHLADHPVVYDRYEQGIVLSSHCLERNLEPMFTLWTELFNSVRWDDDHDHLLQLIRIAATELSASVPHNGHQFAMTRASAVFGGVAKQREICAGLASVAFHRLAAASPDKLHVIVAALKEIGSHVLRASPGQARFAINAEAAAIRPTLQSVERFLTDIRQVSGTGSEHLLHNLHNINTDDLDRCEIVRPSIDARTPNEHFIFPFSTNYVSRALFTAPFTHEDYAKVRVATSLIKSKFLHREIREKGGAYGGGARLDNGGVFAYYSYRDPHVQNTIDTFDRAGEWLLRTDNYTDEDIDEAKLQIFQSVDAPITPSDAGLQYFLAGITNDMKQQYRLRLLDVSKRDIQYVAESYLIRSSLQSGNIVIGPASDYTTGNDQWNIRRLAADEEGGDVQSGGGDNVKK